ncbi:MAG: iron ABC transporter ATP-binding protein [Proteobacteria bacterium]|nr:iron ABC transporter ATP-binding protein [Pseudomonadota bacterium]
MVLKVKNIQCSHGDELAVRGVSFSVERGQTVCLVGPSGCGKTTILKTIAGFHDPLVGDVIINNELVSGRGGYVPTQERKVGMVFQDHALFPHLTVMDNVRAGLWRKSKIEQKKIASDYLEIMGIEALVNRYPHQLSGGQQQRVALARALAPRPLILLMDEPFSSLDLDLRLHMSQEISELLKIHDITCVMVTHDQQDAFVMGEKIGVIAKGQLLQWDTPYDVYHKPATRTVATFIGDGGFLNGKVNENGKIETDFVELHTHTDSPLRVGDDVDVLVRPEDVVLDDKSLLSAKIVKRTYKGAEIIYTLSLNSTTELLASLSSHSYFSVGEEIRIGFQLDHVVAFKK